MYGVSPTLVLLCVAVLTQRSLGLPTINTEGRPEVVVSQGTIIGMEENYTNLTTNRNITRFSYRSIPFAQPPVDLLRFEPPVAAEPFEDGVLDAQKNPHGCSGVAPSHRENCLYLNVYTPESALQDSSLSVMVWLHGGAFILGDIAGYDFNYPVIEKNVILVTVQYRLGVLGFFSTGESDYPGNMGLKDQTMALQWVKDNIEAFGGNKNDITLFGESAGSAAAHFQVLTPDAAGLFDRAILMSGNAMDPWATGRDFANVTVEMAEHFNCTNTTTNQDIVDCLREVNYEVLSAQVHAYYTWNFQPFIFGPRVDNEYIPDEPCTLVKNGIFNKVPLIAGTLKDEMAFETGELFLRPNGLSEIETNFDEIGPVSLQLLPEEDPANTAALIYDYYNVVVTDNITADEGVAVNKMFTDNIFAIRQDWLMQIQPNFTVTYMYQYDHRSSNSTMDGYYNAGLVLTGGEDWVSHGEDVASIFNFHEDADDDKVQNYYTTLFTNFAKFGDPTPDSSLLGFQWPTANGQTLVHLSIKTEPEMVLDERAEERAFWESLSALKSNKLLRPSAK